MIQLDEFMMKQLEEFMKLQGELSDEVENFEILNAFLEECEDGRLLYTIMIKGYTYTGIGKCFIYKIYINANSSIVDVLLKKNKIKYYDQLKINGEMIKDKEV